jgi:endonuclease YncB( thermonuclease family)
VRRWRRRLILLLATALAAVALALFRAGDVPTGLDAAEAPTGPGFTGHVDVVDGDTLRMGSRRIRLDGIDAPESAQTCEREGFAWRCGEDATAALRRFVGTRPVRCVDVGEDRFGRTLARCQVGWEDIGAWMVREGLAVAYTRFSLRYVPEEATARWHRRGLWGGRFEAPEEWRRRHPR